MTKIFILSCFAVPFLLLPASSSSAVVIDDCPAEVRASVQSTGLLPVDYFRAPNVTCDDAVRQAIAASHGACGGGVVFFATACTLTSTVAVPSGTGLQGGASGQSSFQTGPVKVSRNT